MQSSSITANTLSKGLKDANKAPGFAVFTALPSDLSDLLTLFLSDRALANFSSTCRFFRSTARDVYFWEHRLLEAGCPTEILEKLKSLKLIDNYKNLFRAYSQIPNDFRVHITELWEFLCLSGEPSAIEYAIDKEKMTADTRNTIRDEDALFCVARSGNVEGLKILLNLFQFKAFTNRFGVNVFHCVAFSGRVKAMQFIQKNMPEVDPLACLADGKNALHLAGLSADVDGIKYLINDLGMDSESQSHSEETLGHFVAQSGSIRAMKFVFDDLKLDPQARTSKDENILHYVFKSGVIEASHYVTETFGIDPQSLTKNHENILHIGAGHGWVRMMQLAIDTYQISPHSTTKNESNALHWAVANGHRFAAKYALDHLKISPGKEISLGLNILHLGSLSGSPKMVEDVAEIIAKHQLDFHPTKKHPVHQTDAYDYAKQSPHPELICETLTREFSREKKELPVSLNHQDVLESLEPMITRVMSY